MATQVSSTDQTERLLTEREVADVFRVTARTIRRWAAMGTLDAVRLHGVTRYRARDVTALIEPSTSEATGRQSKGSAKTAGSPAGKASGRATGSDDGGSAEGDGGGDD
jgi:excisionase family DNA binding protein